MPDPYRLPAATGPELCVRCHRPADTGLVFEGPPQLHLDVAARLEAPIPDDAVSRMTRRAAERGDGRVCVSLIICEPCAVGKLGIMPVPRNQPRIIPLTELP